MAQTRHIEYTAPTGIDGSTNPDRPWEYLENFMITEHGWESPPGLQKRTAAKGDTYLDSALFFDGRENLVLRLSVDKTTFWPKVRLTCYGLDGTEKWTVTDFPADPSDPSASMASYVGDWWHLPPGSIHMAAYNGRAVMSGSASSALVVTKRLTDLNSNFGYASLGAHHVGPLELRVGDDSEVFPYVAEDTYLGPIATLPKPAPFGAPICCQHLGRLFWAGFKDGQLVHFDREISTTERILSPDLDYDGSHAIMNPQALAWSDAGFFNAIAKVNFDAISSSFPIVALHSWQDRLFIFTTGDIWVMEGFTGEDFSFRKVASGIGCQNAHTVCSSEKGVYFATAGGIYVTTGNETAKISRRIDHLFKQQLPVPDAAWPKLYGKVKFEQGFGKMHFWSERDELWIPVQRAGESERKQWLVYNQHMNEWTTVRFGDALVAGNTGNIEAVHSVAGKALVLAENGIYEVRPKSSVMISSVAGNPGFFTCLAMSKPVLRYRGGSQRSVGVVLYWKYPPGVIPGQPYDSAAWIYSGMNAWAHDANQQALFNGKPDGVDDYTWDGSTWDGTKWTDIAEHETRLNFDLQGEHLRFAMAIRSYTPVRLRATSIDTQHISVVGREVP